MGSLTPKQKQVLTFIKEYTQEHGYGPTQQEIARQFGFSSLGTVQNYLTRLEEQGYIKRPWNEKRAIEVVRPVPGAPEAKLYPFPPTGDETKKPDITKYMHKIALQRSAPTEELPLAGRVAAGQPIEAVETPDTISVPSSMYGEDHFVLKVEGDSMIEDGILDGDFVVVKKQPLARSGQTVVALIEGEATIKRFYRKNQHVELHPANPALRPIIIKQGEFNIAGVVVGVIRHYK